VKLLLNDQRIDINKPNEYNQTPFYIVCNKGRIEIVKSQQKLALQNGREIEKQIIFFDQPKNKRD